MLVILSICLLLVIPAASATEYTLNTTSIEQFRQGISYTGSDELVIGIEDDVTIESNTDAGIESAAPVTIRSPDGRTLSIQVTNESEMIYGIRAPSVSIESGHINIVVKGKNQNGTSNAYGICAESDNVSISGGSVFTTVETPRHKNKGIYASRFVLIAGGLVNVTQHGGSNTFGLDSGELDAEKTYGGVRISGGRVLVNSSGALNRNIGIDSLSGTIEISGNTVVVVRVDGSGARQNYAYNPNITSIYGMNL